MSNRAAEPNAQAIARPDEAQAIVGHLNEIMDALLQLVERETDLVRAGRMRDAAQLEPTKADLARLYSADTLRLRASKRYLEAHHHNLVKALRQRHQNFQAMLQINLTVLATAHAVAEGVVRGVADEMTRKRQPQVYGASGRQAMPRTGYASPIATNRSL